MVNKVRTLDFLPEIFKTDTNRQFLRATLDVLTSQPDLRRVQGFIGEKYGYSVEPTDRYVVEPTKTRRDYQLDPSVVFLKPGTQTAQDFIDYPGIVQALKNQGALTKNHDRLFESQFYSWDPFVDLDKLVNYSQYYWLPLGPDPVPVSVDQLFLNQDYAVEQDDNGYKFINVDGTNPTLTLLRGGTYTFNVNGDNPFWIQGVPGLTGYAPGSNVDTREVLGVSNNGATAGTITFTVPAQDAQQAFAQLPGNNTVDLVTSLPFSGVDGQTTTALPSIDGITNLNGKTLLFYDNGDPGSQITYYTITVTAGVITLTPGAAIINNEKITALSGDQYAGRIFYRDTTGAIQLVPYNSSILDTLYYQNGNDELSVGIIKLVQSNSANSIDVSDILGRKNYTSPNGIRFTNGLKIIFQGNITPAVYQNREYYVEGVGSSINLLPVDEYLAVEPTGEAIYNPWSLTGWDTSTFDIELYVPVTPEYITINRNSPDRNAWSRSNRWFHQDVLNVTEQALGTVTKSPNNSLTRAQRPIVEFRGGLRLFDMGTRFRGYVDCVAGPSITDAFSQVAGFTSATAPLIDGQTLNGGTRLIFPYDTDANVRNKVYSVSFVPSGSDPVITLVPEEQILDLDLVVAVNGTQYSGTTWWYHDASLGWENGQYKQIINQPPLFDIFDQSGISLADNLVYPSSDFAGTRLFSYRVGTGQDDPVLGFPIVYSNPSTLGDIEFTVNLNSDIFSYSGNAGNIETLPVNVGFVYGYRTRTDFERYTGWVPAVGPSFQYQVFEFPVTEAIQSRFICDVPASTTTPWNAVQVYYNDNVLDQTAFAYLADQTQLTTVVDLAVPATAGDKVTVLVISDYASKTAYYEIPSNLENNPFNTNITSVSVGDLRNQYRSIFTNNPDTTGALYGDNNYHDLGDINKYGTSIIQNSASLVLPATFLRRPGLEFFQALQFNSEQYTLYKQLIVDLAVRGDYSVYQKPSEILDNIIYQISKVRDGSTAFFWSDMLPSGSPYVSNTYTFGAATNTATFNLSNVWTPTWFEQANYNGLAIYVNSVVNNRNVYTQLTRGVDYTVSQTNATVTVTYPIGQGDTVTVNEYNQTYGSYCPNTPSKLGMYPAFQPAVVLDNSYTRPTYFILGHDGSYNKLFGDYDPVTGTLDDFRDIALLEFELRVYNNIKVDAVIALQYDDVIPGQFRTTDYTWAEILDMYSTNFLNWVGVNRIDYKEQIYNIANRFTYNYNEVSNKLSNTAFKQGYWRGIYRWFYDTDTPNTTPWQMLGLANEPDWWTSRYGPAPYTGDNTFMWQDIAQGYVWNNGAPYINEKRVRPELLQVIPVDGAGDLLSPFDCVMGIYNSLTFQRNWRVGDGAPAEASYIKSSTWAFDLMRLLALTKPAQFFNLFVDQDQYKFDADFDQFLYNRRYHLDPRTIQVYGNGVSKTSYINWVVDYVNQRGENGYDAVSTTLANLDVRLTYNLAGFSAKDYLKFLVETATPNSRNTNLLIPDESYQVLLYDNVPEDTIVYSSIIVQKTAQGWTVYGNSQNRQYFVVQQPRGSSFYQSITAGELSVQVSQEYNPEQTITVPYGTLFYSVDAVSEFIMSYGEHLRNQGVTFTNVIDGIVYDWQRIVQEFLIWAQQEWEVGSAISLNPNATTFTVDRDGLVVQPLTIQQENFILNQNLFPLQSQDVSIVRENTAFNVNVVNPADTVAYTNLHLASMEHAVVFDNFTAFNDTIYNLVTGLRQQRLLLQGYKTGNWQGYVNTAGFILNEDNIQEWQPNVKYPKGAIVTYKGFYWTSVTLIEPSAEFSTENWLKTEYDQIKTGLLPNPSTNAYESLYYYDINRANLEQDADLLSYSLIGFRPRQYMADADLSDTTQVNVYRNIVKEKGTNSIANAFRNAQLIQGKIDYKIQENWALKNGDFGAVLNSNFVEFVLNQNKLKGNPTLIGFVDQGTMPDVQQSVNVQDFTNWERPVTNANWLPAYVNGSSNERGLPTAGYVNTNDATLQEYYFDDLNLDNANIQQLHRNDTVWIANHKSDWNIYAAVGVNTQLIAVTNNLNGSALVTFAANPGLAKDDLIAVLNFDSRVNGFYTVTNVVNETTVTLNMSLDPAFTVVQGQGTAFRLVSRRFAQPSDSANNLLPYTAWQTRKIWADEDQTGNWAVYGTSPVFREQNIITQAQATNAGVSVAYTSELGTLSLDGQSRLYRNGVLQPLQGGIGSGSTIIALGSVAFISSPQSSSIFSYTVDSNDNLVEFASPVSTANTGQIAVSSDYLWMYVSNTAAGTVSMFALNQTTMTYQLVQTYTAPVGSMGWGSSIATSTDGVKLFVGAPYENANGIFQSGAVYTYSRKYQRYYGNGSTTTYTITNPPASTVAYVYINDVLQTGGYTFNGGTLTFTTAPADGAVVTIQMGGLYVVQKLVSAAPHQGGLYGISLDTNRYGADFIVGCPYEMSTVTGQPNVEGAVHRYTNSGQRYGTVYCTVAGTATGTVLIDGYVVNFTGTANDIVNQINAQTPINIVASMVTGTEFIISVKPGTPETLFNILDVTGLPASIAALGITTYVLTQTIYNPDSTNNGGFGSVVRLNERYGLVISSPQATRPSPATFDLRAYCLDDDTVFDNDATLFIDNFANTGLVYEFTYLPAANENIYNPGKYAFGQYISSSVQTGVANQANFGTSLAYSDGVIVVGAPNYYATGHGLVAQYNTNWTATYPCEVRQVSPWYVDKAPLPQVNINAINTIGIYNRTTNETLEWLDYIDPVQGKILGAVATNLDYMSTVDPAGYGLNDVAWTSEYVGKTWLDLNTIRLLNYNQPDIVYDASNWARAFPGSTADIYTWVESTNDPTNYTGPGFPANLERFVSVNSLDRSTNSLITRYYFWVKYYDQVPAGKSLSPLIVTQYLLDPLSSGIAFLAPITRNAIALYNSAEYIQADASALHINYQTAPGLDDKHTSWTLIRENNAEDFLAGFYPGLTPADQYLKFLESFTGLDQAGQTVPDPRLPLLVRYGMSFRPRQSMFVDRRQALENYCTYANNIMIRWPIAESKNLNFLKKTGPGYNTSEYWYYVDWWAEGFGADTKPVLEVANVGDLQTLVNNQLVVGSEGLTLLLEDGLVVKVANNNSGSSEYYVYNTDTGWVRIGLTNGTIQIADKLWQDIYGWSTNPWSSQGWDNYPTQEIYWIIRWLNEYCYTNELDDQRNASLILMFKYIQTESLEGQNYLPWLNKTSLIDVNHKVRDLLPYKKFQRDNQEFLAGYLNEVKPYHVYIKDFVFSYDGFDVYPGNVTDFDLPAQYNSASGQFETPRMVYQETFEPDEYTPENLIWQEPEYKQWFSNYGLSITNREVGLSQVTTLVNYLTELTETIELKNAYGLPFSGVIKIAQEEISYNGIDYINNTLTGVERGANGSPRAVHYPGSPVLTVLPSVIVLDQGRAYTEPPQITAYINLAVYPAPNEIATFRPIMALDRLIGVEVLNPGAGYAVKPEIYISPSVVTTFSSTDFNPVDNTIYIADHPFQTGDCVLYAYDLPNRGPVGLTDNSYYYVRSIDANNIALYNTYQDAVQATEVSTSDSRVPLITQGSGSEFRLGITARAVCLTSGMPVREFGISLRYDRVTYRSNITDWSAGQFYAGVYESANYSSGSEPASSTEPSSLTGVVLPITNKTANTAGNTVLTVTYGAVPPAVINGQQFSLYYNTGSAWTNQAVYYLKVISATQLEVYTDALMRFPVPFAEFNSSLNVAYLAEPFTYARSMVMYGGKLWRCVDSNNDSTFQISKWELVSADDPGLTAADRIIGFYRPDANMPGRDIRQLMTGVEYTNATFQGLDFEAGDDPDNALVDTRLLSPDFAWDSVTEPTAWDVQGGAFAEGYGPEELVPGLLTDGLNFNVTTKPGVTWPPFEINSWDEPAWGFGPWDPDVYDHTGFNVVQFRTTVSAPAYTIDFAQAAANPVSLVIFAQTTNPTTNTADQFRVPDISSNYTVDWPSKTITVNSAYLRGVELVVVVYEFGNGDQMIRGDNSVYPLRTVDGHSEIYLPVKYSDLTVPDASNYYGSASVYVNGRRIPYLNQVSGAGEYFTIEPQVNNPCARIIMSGLYSSLDYVTFVANAGPSGYSVPQTQIIQPVTGVYTYDLDYFMGDDNIDNVIVERNGYRLYDVVPNENIVYKQPNISGYTIPITGPYIPVFNPAQLQVEVANTVVTPPNYAVNFDSSTLSAAGLDGEWNAQFGYLDVGVELSSDNLYVVFEPTTFAPVPVGTDIIITYSTVSVSNPYTIAYNPAIDKWQITFNNALSLVGETITVTSFNRTDQQSLKTDVYYGVTVTEITNVNLEDGFDMFEWSIVGWASGIYIIDTLNPHALTDGDQVSADSLDGSLAFTGFAKVTSPTQFVLFSDMALTTPYTGTLNYSGSGGFVWQTDTFVLDQPDYYLYNTERLWVTVTNTISSPGGSHLDSSALRLYNNVYYTDGTGSQYFKNTLGVLREITPLDQVIALSMVPAENPGETSFRVSVDKYAQPAIYRTNQFTRTYLTQQTVSTGRIDDVLHVADISRLLKIQQHVLTPDVNDIIGVVTGNALATTAIKIVDSLGTVISDYVINPAQAASSDLTANNNQSLNIKINQPYVGSVTVTTGVGNIAYIQGEYVGFTKADLDNNTLTGLRRGLYGTITNTVFEQYSTAQSVLDRDRFPANWYDENWYDRYAPLQLNYTVQAAFLNQHNP